MRIDAVNRTATLSVGEFAAFRPYATPGFGGIAALWRAQVGTQWHQRIQEDSHAAGEGMENERPIQGKLLWRNWTLQLSGRIDQLKRSIGGDDLATTPRVHLREIKTLNEPLPLAKDALLERYLSYPVQLLAYRELMLANAKLEHPEGKDFVFTLELLLVEIGSGLTQSLLLDRSYDPLLVDHLDALVDYLEAQQERLGRLRSLSVRPAYPTPRPGQETIQMDLDRAFELSAMTLLEAPTGYGKTGVAWEYAARQLASGRADRVLYLTSKATGQTEAVDRLRALLAAAAIDSSANGSSAPASFWQIRNKQEHCVNAEFRCSTQSCSYLLDQNRKWREGGLQRLYLLAQDEVTLETLREEGRAMGICPYEIMRAGLGYRDIWIGDYNYLFSPSSARLLEDQPDFDVARTFLIVDEAHNLPSRVCSAFTFDLSLVAVYAAADDLGDARASSNMRRLLKDLGGLLSCLPTMAYGSSRGPDSSGSALPTGLAEDFRELVSRIAESLLTEAIPYDALQPETSELLFKIAATGSAQARGELEHLLWTPSEGVARLECIDASKLIAERLAPYAGVLALSATLSPVESFLEEIGLSDRPLIDPLSESTLSLRDAEATIAHLRPRAPWREGAYDVAIDLRVDTRYKSRERFMDTTARTIASVATAQGPAVVFFPSYVYAQRCFELLGIRCPEIRAALQPRSAGTLADRERYLEEALAFHDALFLILGSSYAEGVDSLGGKAGTVMVVSPALPEMNIAQEAKRQRHDRVDRKGFERAYLQPGIQKVNQALGRLVRAPGQRVKALLHCQRYGEPQTRRLLDPSYQKVAYLHNDEDLAKWLSQR